MRHHQGSATSLERSPAALGYPKSARGEYGQWQHGRCFSTYQMEWHQLTGVYADGDTQFGVIELESGEWLSDLFVDGQRHPDRQTALAAAASDCIRRVTKRAESWLAGPISGPRFDVVQANAVIAWAAGIAGIPARLMTTPAPAARPAAPTWPRDLVDLMEIENERTW